MANRYFKLAAGNNNWSSTGTWCTLADGSDPGASVPTSADAVLPSSNIASGATLIVDTATQYGLSMDWTGVTNNPTLSMVNHLTFYGNCTFVPVGTMSRSGNKFIYFANTSGTAILTTAGQVLYAVSINGNGGTVQLGDSLSCTYLFVSYGKLDTLTKSIVATSSVSITGTGTRALDMSGSTITCATWDASVTTSLTFTTNASSKIIVTGATTFNGGSLTNYKEVNLNGSGTTTITGSNTFANLVLPSGTTQTIKFTDGTTQHVAACSLSGSVGKVHTLTGTSTAGWNLVKDGGGTVVVSYCTITYSVASPADTWYYDATCTYNSTSGWSVYVPPPVIRMTVESIGLSDLYINRYRSSRPIAETIGLTDSGVTTFMAWVIKVATEIIGITDSLIRRALSTRLIAEVIGITDSVIRRLRSIRLKADTIGITETMVNSFLVYLIKIINETIGITETLIKRAWSNRFIQETIGLTDSLIKRMVSTRFIAEVVGLTDALLRRGKSLRWSDDTINVNDGTLRRLWSVRAINEIVGVTDSLVRRLRSIRLITEAIAITDISIVRAWSVRVINEVIGVTETLLRRLRSIRYIPDTVGVTDSSIKRAWLIKMTIETVGLIDSLIKRARSIRLIAETVGIFDTGLWNYWFKKLITETIRITEHLFGVAHMLKFIRVQVSRIDIKRLAPSRIPLYRWLRRIFE